MELLHLFFTFLLVVFISILARLFDALVLKPQRLRSKLWKQGIRGPPPTILVGNILEIIQMMREKGSKSENGGGEQVISHNCSLAVFLYMNKWREQYGPTFVYSMGNIPVVHMSHPDVMKDFNSFKSKPTSQQRALDSLFGEGLVTTNGEVWAQHRKVLAPELYMDKVKGMMKVMLDGAVSLVEEWNSKINESENGVAEIKIDEYFRSFSGDVISRACFGNNNCKLIFSKLRALQEIVSNKVYLQGIPGLRYLPIKSNRQMWKLDKEIRTLILEEAKERNKETSENYYDMLKMIVEGAKNSGLGQAAMGDFIVDSCKNACFPAYENGSASAAWILMCLALYPEWQNKVRSEVLDICGGELPNHDMIRKMNMLTMVIYETLRLYPIGSLLTREALEDIKFGGIDVPKGVNVVIAMVALYRDPNIWGADVDKFNPERFANGVNGACKLPQMFIPFGSGPRSCIGQHFAMAELKVLVSLIISNFKFSLSPKYRHSPIMKLIIEPEYGVDLLVSCLPVSKSKN